MRFDGKVAVITGASAGIGRAAALAFAREGAAVVIADKDLPAGEAVAQAILRQGGRAEARQTDVAREDSVAELFAGVVGRWGQPAVLVNNAGIYYQADALQTPLSAWNEVLAVNLTGAFLCSKRAASAMSEGGAIVNVASEAGLVGIRGQVAYNVSKAGLISLTRSCAVDFAARGIRVNCVCPGTTDTPLVQAALARAPDAQALRRALEQARPAGRLGQPEEIAAAILFLAGDEARYATGAVLSVDGGYTAQ